MKRKYASIFIVTVLMLIMLCSLSGCMKITLRKDNILSRLKENGYTTAYKQTTEVVKNNEGTHQVKEIIEATKEEKDKNFIVTIYNCGSESTAIWVEDLANKYNSENKLDFEIYRFQDVVLYGDFESLSIARNY